jgi:predicted ATPase/DNA-binding CsgD family transcriptional regulator
MNVHARHLPAISLTEREAEVLRLLAEGLSNREIAEQLVTTTGTIKWYNRQIYNKLSVGTRTEAVRRAAELQLLNRNQPLTNSDLLLSFTLKHNLPAETTQFIGREREVIAVKRLLQTARLVTLTGPPGTGKSRLALQTASTLLYEFTDGVYFVPFALLTDPALAANAIASALGVEEVGSQPLTEALKQHLRDKQMLLVLDNFEHLLPAAPLLSELLATAPSVKMLVTSREALHLYGEQEYAVPPMALPAFDDSPNELSQCESVVLFLQRARAVKSNFDLTAANALDIAKICVRLDGLPLAIELAAARVKLMTPQTLLARLSSRLETLTGGARDLPLRQQTLRSTIDWSYHLLDNGEKILFARLAVFRGGWTLDAAEAICDNHLPIALLDGLTSLVDKSLVKQEEVNGVPRFTILSTIHEYALERLEASAEAEILRRYHATFYTAYAERIAIARHGMDLPIWLNAMEIEHDNFRAVLSWSLDGDPEPGLRLMYELSNCWRIRGYLVEGIQWAQRLLEKSQGASPLLRAKALFSTVMLGFDAAMLGLYVSHDWVQAIEMSREAVALAERTGDNPTTAWSLFALGISLAESEKYHEARAVLNQALALFTEVNDTWGLARALNWIGLLFAWEGDYQPAMKLFEQSLELRRQLGNPSAIGNMLQNTAALSHRMGDNQRAAQLFAESLKIAQELGDKYSIARCLVRLAGVIVVLGQPMRAVRLYGAAQWLYESIGVNFPPRNLRDYERSLAAISAQLDDETFERLWKQGREMSLDQVIEYALEAGDV